MSTLAIIPVYNEEKTIRKVISGVSAHIKDILVVDNCSSDRTVEISRKNKVQLLIHKKNQGKAQSLIDGIGYALERGYDSVVLIDGDLEHDPALIPAFLKGLRSSDMVVGQRKTYRSKGRSALNKWSGIWFSLVIPGIVDVQCGYRACRASLLKKMSLSSRGFEIEMEMLLEAVKHRGKISTVDIRTNPRRRSNLGWRDYIRMNNFFDRWVINNSRYIRIEKVKKAFLLTGAYLGLATGSMIEGVTGWIHFSA